MARLVFTSQLRRFAGTPELDSLAATLREALAPQHGGQRATGFGAPAAIDAMRFG